MTPAIARQILGLFFFLVIASCTFTQKIKDGETAFEFKQYQLAIQMLSDEVERTNIKEVKARKAFLIAESHVANDELEASLPWYRMAYENDMGEIALYKYAGILKRLERYESALKVYDALMASNAGNPIYRTEKAACERAIRWQQNPANYEIVAMPFNSVYSDYSPMWYDQDRIIFTSDRSTSSGDELYAWTGNKYSDFFLTDQQGNVSQNFEEDINSDFNEGTITFSSSFSEAIFTRCGDNENNEDGYCKLYHVKKKRIGWTTPELLPFTQEGINYMHPALGLSDSFLIFAANLDGGQGGFDLYVSVRNGTAWNDPIPLSTRINTPENEKFPYLLSDTLYFSSDRQGGLGGLDIYKTYLDAERNWTLPVMLPPPINSGADDFSIIFEPAEKLLPGEIQKGYFTSSRNPANKDDIYQFIERVPVEEVVVEQEEPKQVEYELFLALQVVEKVFAREDDPNSEVIGKKPVDKAIVTINGEVFETDSKGRVIQTIAYDKNYVLASGKPGYLRDIKEFSTSNELKDPDNPIRTINKELVLDKIYVGKEIILQNIYYDLDKWDIRDDAKPTLDTLAIILLQNPSINIVLGSHTDCRDTDTYNLDLSHKRAKSAVDYLIARGVKRSRLRARGYGESVLLEKCICEECSEEQHQRNRRTTFSIVN